MSTKQDCIEPKISLRHVESKTIECFQIMGEDSASAVRRRIYQVLAAPIDALSLPEAVQRISSWARCNESRYVCISNVHSVVSASQDPAFLSVLRQADLVTPDGAPVAWVLRRLGVKEQHRVCGPDLMEEYFSHAVQTDESVFLYGSDEETLGKLEHQISLRWPKLKIAGAIAPPFRPLTAEEDEKFVAQINKSGAGTVWVSLGCPKQELWMSAHRGYIQAVMIGVGAAFSFHALTVSRAPEWMRRSGFEWLYRFLCEPRRLWRRYLTTNSIFIFGVARQLIRK